jgi:cyclophilin family peptidyl-prolyl cis-trans isomerase/HEAT repeat protein
MQTGNFRKTLNTALLITVSITLAAGQKLSSPHRAGAVPDSVLLRILRAEDQRRWDQSLNTLLGDQDPSIRKRAALALGRIGDERAVPGLSEALKSDTDGDVRQMIAFALGEIESPDGTDTLVSILNNSRESGAIRARAVEALGKIGAVLLSAPPDQTTAPKTEDKRLTRIRLAILETLKFEAGRRAMPDRSTILLGLTAALRVRPEGAGPVIIQFLDYADPRIVADALNTMARLRLKDGSDQVRQLLSNSDAIVRANAARVIGAAEDKGAYDALLDRALNDSDLRVRVSAIRALGSLKDARAATSLLDRAEALFKGYRILDGKPPSVTNELLEMATTLGRLLEQLKNDKALNWLREFRRALAHTAPEVDIALARIDPERYSKESLDVSPADKKQPNDVSWQSTSTWVQGLAEANKFGGFSAQQRRGVALVIGMLVTGGHPSAFAIPDILRSYASFKPNDLPELLSRDLRHPDVIVRATAAELLSDLPPSEATTRALIEALPVALRDKDLNDAALSILDALAKQKSPAANDAIKTGLDSTDHLIRRRAVALLKTNGVGDFSNRIGTVKTRNTEADYRRAISRIGKKVTATVVTSKGAFTIEFLPQEAPLTVDNFVQLARRSYFNGQTVPRVVPNFVIQTGDPRGDQNGGPGYQIRCEINEAPYDRGAVGMALSGKDTGGSQWFVTHSPQPHLDGGYTVFGRVIRGMDVVDNIARGDTIIRVMIVER